MLNSPETVADDFYAAIERNDFDAVGAIYADDLKTWRSFDQVSQTKTEQMATLAQLNAQWASDYRVIERYSIGEHVVQRHELTMTERDGPRVQRLQAAVFLTIRDGQVHLLTEYLDSRDVKLLTDGWATASG